MVCLTGRAGRRRKSYGFVAWRVCNLKPQFYERTFDDQTNVSDCFSSGRGDGEAADRAAVNAAETITWKRIDNRMESVAGEIRAQSFATGLRPRSSGKIR